MKTISVTGYRSVARIVQVFVVRDEKDFQWQVERARVSGRDVQLRRACEYGRTVYVVSGVPGEGFRFGRDAEGEIVRPSDPLVGGQS